MRRRFVLTVILILALSVACFAESLDLDITFTLKYESENTYSITFSPAIPSGYTIKWNRSTYTEAQLRKDPGHINQNITSKITLQSENQSLVIKIQKNGSYPVASDRPMDFIVLEKPYPTSGTKTYTCFTSDGNQVHIGDPSEEQTSQGNVWFESANDVFSLETGNATPTRDASINIGSSYCLGKIASADSSDRIAVTVETSGRFVSASDPSSYLDFQVALVPKYSTSSSTDNPYCYTINPSNLSNGSVSSGSDLAPSTDNAQNSLTFVLPKTDGTSSSVGSNNAAIEDSSLYLVMCFDTPDTETLKRLAVTNDYYASLEISWECAEASCEFNGAHTHTQHVVLRAYLGNEYVTAVNDWVNLSISPEPNAGNLNILSLFDRGGNSGSSSATIATINITTGSRTTDAKSAYQWKDHVFVFLSSSSNFTDSSAEGFNLVGGVSGNVTIPFTVGVYSTNDSLIKEFDGTTYWGQSVDPSSYCLNLGTMGTTTSGSYTYGFINFTGTVKMIIPQAAINELKENQYRAGRYREYIYYHLVYTD